MISCRHSLLDDRIYKKEALTLVRNGYTVIHIGYGEEFKDFYTDDAVRLIQVKQTKMETLCFYALLRAAKSVAADVYHLHDVELCRIALKLKKLPWRPKVIYDAHEPYLHKLLDYWKERTIFKVLLNDIPAIIAERYILNKVDYLIATESNVAKLFMKKNKKCETIYNYSYFSFNKPIEDIKKTYDIIYCGGVANSHGISLMLNALNATNTAGYNYKFVVVGGFQSRKTEEQAKKIIKKYNLEEQVNFVGQVKFEDVSKYYTDSKVSFCLLPNNRSNKIALAIKIFEYAAYGLPIVGSNFGHTGEIIEEEKIGIAVNPHDSKEVANALIYLLEDSRYKEMENRCISCVNEKYLWKYQEEKLLNIYKQLNICNHRQG